MWIKSRVQLFSFFALTVVTVGMALSSITEKAFSASNSSAPDQTQRTPPLDSYPAEIKAALAWMMKDGKIDKDHLEELDFTEPSSLNFQDSPKAVFSKQGGGLDPIDLEEEYASYKEYFAGPSRIVITLGNNISGGKDEKPSPDLLFVLYPISAKGCNRLNWKQTGMIEEAHYLGVKPIKLSIPLNLTPSHIPVSSKDIAELPKDSRIICYQGPDNQYYYIYTLVER